VGAIRHTLRVSSGGKIMKRASALGVVLAALAIWVIVLSIVHGPTASAFAIGLMVAAVWLFVRPTVVRLWREGARDRALPPRI
jgi:hypothetical protein